MGDQTLKPSQTSAPSLFYLITAAEDAYHQQVQLNEMLSTKLDNLEETEVGN